MFSWRTVLRALLPFALHGLAREVDAAVGVLLHTSLDLPNFVGQALGLLEAKSALVRLLAWTAGGAAVWLSLAVLDARRSGKSLEQGLRDEAAGFAPLYLRPVITVLALLALGLFPAYPYGFTLPVALTQDLGIAQDTLALAALLALRWPTLRLPAPKAGAIFFPAFLAYGALSPPWAREWEAHPGNEPKTLRMAVALGHGLTLDVEGVSAPMEELTPRPLLASAWSATRTVVRESGLMMAGLARGTEVFRRSSIRASQVTRQTIRGKEGGVFYVLAPGPSLLLAPTLRIDRALNRRWGVAGRLGVTLLVWNALAAALVAAVFLLLRDATGRAGLSALLAGAFALFPPYVFYFFQFYPEMLGALALAVVLRFLLFVPRWSEGTAWWLGGLIAFLPWLHQKFLPVWAVLVVMVAVRAVHEMVTLRSFIGLVAPQVLTLYLTALYNFAITGSVRPDAIYLAWGPGGVATARMGQGLLGLLLDARFGLLPYAPIYLLAAGGLLMAGRGASRLRLALPAMAVYYLTVASADNWSGAVCNLGRYVMPVTPYAIALVGVAVTSLLSHRGGLTLALTLGGWTALMAFALFRDPHAANDCALLLARSAFADGNVYIPNLLIRTWGDGAPGLLARVLVWLALAILVGLSMRRAVSPVRTLAGIGLVLLAAALILERWPSTRTGARFGNGIDAGQGVTVFVDGPVVVEEERARAHAGTVELLVRSRSSLGKLAISLEGEGTLGVPGRPLAESRGAVVETPLTALGTFTGRRGVGESLSRGRIEVEAVGEVGLRFRASP